MSDEKMHAYIQNKRSQGLTDAEIKSKLLSVGWNELQVAQEFAGEDDVPRPAQVGNTPLEESKTNLWDVFEHVILFISLYVFSISLGLMIHYFIDKYLPATTYEMYGSYDSYQGNWQDTAVTGYASALIVSFPILYFLFRKIAIRTQKNPVLRRGKVRKILIYLTLISTFVILIYKAITTVYTLLNGNITINFLLHLIVTVGIAAVIFAYYFMEVREDRSSLKSL
ncbi:MAG: DUF5671 domain-containing protein [bacterium]|nr:DUF5671 domain-containing protein [bacterium]